MTQDMNQTPSANRTRIAFFGMRNAGKSSVVNAVTGQAVSIVSPVAGTTTDPVRKAMEILPLGPVLIVDTPGLDDEGEVGALRVSSALLEMERADAAVLVVDATRGLCPQDRQLLERLDRAGVPHITVYNKCDLARPELSPGEIAVSAKTGENIPALRDALAGLVREAPGGGRRLLGDLLAPGDAVVLVTPIDESAPKGRMILPQVQALRDALDAGAYCAVAQPEALPAVLAAMPRPQLVVTDSQAFGAVARIVPPEVPLTSFSILFARFKGVLGAAVRGAEALDGLRDGDRVLISEGCTHRRQCKDIGSVKLPAWIEGRTGKSLHFAFTSGGEFPRDVSDCALVVHCGGCMLGEREVLRRLSVAQACGVPFTNYGVLIAHIHGILRRSLSPFPEY